ncbi:MAG: Gfo/Idh/MocA family oxidoreductase [Dysgonamonadaceae bacterium]|jgi:predicted dehydrogenase|nr:Gfo/Idh/MocA family oxidoreductase [Dysgonamonadaceae bacterium]
METGKIRFAVVGCGHIGKRHIEMIRRNPEAELSAVCDILPVDFPPAPYFSSLDDLLSSGIAFDVLNICTPNGLHAPMAIRGLETGHHVVIEKPMALNTQEAGRILQVAEQYNRNVFCVMQNRYSPPSVWMKEVIDSGRLGKIFLVQVNCYWNRDERYYRPGGWHGTKDLDGGTLFTQFSHFIDLMYWLFGDITNIRARFADFNHQALTGFEDSGIVSFEFTGGGMGLFSYSTSVYDRNFESSVTIIAEKGTVKIGGQYMNEVEYCYIKDYTLPELAPTNPGNDYGAYKGSAQNHHYVIANVVNVLRNKAGETITTHAQEGYKVVDIIERIYGTPEKTGVCPKTPQVADLRHKHDTPNLCLN